MKIGLSLVYRLLLLTLAFCSVLTGINSHVWAQDEQVVASDDGALSVHVPAGWVFRSLGASVTYASVLVFAENSTVLDGAINSFYLGSGTPPGDYGIVAVVDPGFWSLLSSYPEDALFAVLQNLTTNPAAPLTINDQFQYTLGDLYNAVVMDASAAATNTRSYIGGFVADNDVILFRLSVSPLVNFEDERLGLEQIGDSIRVPAEPNALTAISVLATPTQGRIEDLPTREAPTEAPATVVPPTTAASETTVEPTGELLLVTSSGGRLSLVLPSTWIVYDLAADEGVYAYGDSDMAGLSRLASVRPDLVNQVVAPTGIGGIIVLYSMSNFGIDPEAVDLKPLMAQLLQNLTGSGYEVVERALPLGQDTSAGLYAVVRGGEYGFIALVPFGDEIAYITATGMPDSFEANRDFLMSIVQSVSVPAAVPAPEPTSLPGLGGLGGLQPATPVPTAVGLGGLGGLVATAEATATVAP